MNNLSLREDGMVHYAGDNWRIILVNSAERILAERVKDKQLEFLAISNLSSAVFRQDQVDPANRLSIANVPNVGRSNYTSTLKRRRVRVLPSEELPDDIKQKIAIAIEEFQLAKSIFATSGQARRDLIKK